MSELVNNSSGRKELLKHRILNYGNTGMAESLLYFV
jgi:hypothetical protein